MEISFDNEADALYIKFRDGKFHKNNKIDDLTVIDMDKDGNMLGIEFLKAKERIPLDSLKVVNVKKML